jgi:hypothetical protein
VAHSGAGQTARELLGELSAPHAVYGRLLRPSWGGPLKIRDPHLPSILSDVMHDSSRYQAVCSSSDDYSGRLWVDASGRLAGLEPRHASQVRYTSCI